MERISKENYYLNIAQTVSSRGTCLRRKFGAIIIKNDEIYAYKLITEINDCRYFDENRNIFLRIL